MRLDARDDKINQAMLKSDIAQINRWAKEVERDIKEHGITLDRAKVHMWNKCEPMMNDLIEQGFIKLHNALDGVIEDSIREFSRLYK